MNRRNFVRGLGSTLLAMPGGLLVAASRAEQREAPNDLGDLLEAIRERQGLPGVAAAAVRGDRVVAEGVAGVRRVGEDARIAPGDRFSLASCTKRMTATMVCRVIDAGSLSFDTTLADALPDVAIRDAYKPVTVAQLLTHTGGIPPYTRVRQNDGWVGGLKDLKGSASAQREQFVRHLLQEEPAVEPGTARVYSNAGYALVAFVASRRTGRTWEALMEGEVFRPLGMGGAGFGRPRTRERPNEPARHLKGEEGFVPEAEREGDALEALAAAGGVHCPIRDFARFASYELAAARGKDPLLSPATARRWQGLSGGEGANDRPRQFFGGSPAISAGCALWPGEDAAVVVAVNGGSADVKGIIEAVKKRSLT